MNHISQRNRLEARLKNYIDFMPDCPMNSRLKLSKEMVKISERLDKIKSMSVSELVKEVPSYYDTKQSKINFKTI